MKITKIEPSSLTQQTTISKTVLSTYSDQPLAIALKWMFPQFGAVLIQELLTRSGLNGEQSVARLRKDEIDRLLAGALRLKEELLSPPSPRVYFSGTSPVRFSIIPLQHLSGFQFRNFDSVVGGNSSI